MAFCALQREESRGGHFRSDFPEERKEWKHRTFIELANAELAIAEITGKAPVTA
jgi:L-aspartate oxidase